MAILELSDHTDMDMAIHMAMDTATDMADTVNIFESDTFFPSLSTLNLFLWICFFFSQDIHTTTVDSIHTVIFINLSFWTYFFTFICFYHRILWRLLVNSNLSYFITRIEHSIANSLKTQPLLFISFLSFNLIRYSVIFSFPIICNMWFIFLFVAFSIKVFARFEQISFSIRWF